MFNKEKLHSLKLYADWSNINKNKIIFILKIEYKNIYTINIFGNLLAYFKNILIPEYE